ncbi:MAG: GNAT family protein [Alphaproteobacteria bacterium]|nr:GNAT family protein [Alphaproteobacteria bacterium]
MTELFTERLHLKPLEHGDLTALEKMFADAQHMWDLMDIPGRSNDATELASFYLRRSLWAFEQYGAGIWGMRAIESPDEAIVGYTGLLIYVGEVIDTTGEVETGWAVAPGHSGKGYAVEGTRAVFDHLFDGLGAQRVAAITSPDNWPSRRLMERLGLVHEKDITAYQGTQVFYAIARDSWRARSVRT